MLYMDQLSISVFLYWLFDIKFTTTYIAIAWWIQFSRINLVKFCNTFSDSFQLHVIIANFNVVSQITKGDSLLNHNQAIIWLIKPWKQNR